MTRINISPVTRIEGHAEVRIEVDSTGGGVESAHFNVVELRGGFEKFMIGAAVEEAPRITPTDMRNLSDLSPHRVSNGM
ncbi:hypothetical protein [Methanogenium cariaci]|uniref:hypothetical protein n=1 Tax=Methanogenium cariaci TaxID=2197 RepID=UPI001FE0BD75|nr:hypothetical protein [Methanogenium cariaci]